MKIRTITCSIADNQGARLQALALVAYLRAAGHDAQVIDYRPSTMRWCIKRFYWPGADIKEWGRLFLRYAYRDRTLRRRALFDEFSERFLPRTPEVYLTLDQLRKEPPPADVYIAGSDQIWNSYTAVGRDKAFMLDFGAPETRRLSYAASFSHPDVDEAWAREAKPLLQRFAGVSVREPSGVGILRGMGVEGTRVLDPVFLMPADYWAREIADATSYSDTPYVLVYDFESSPEVEAVARRIARLHGLKIWSVSPRRLRYADRDLGVCSPSTFVALIRDARCVVGNSFHSAVFSMVFGKDFFVVNRRDGLNTRMAELLGCYSLTHRLVDSDATDDTLLAPIDYSAVQPALDADIARSKHWLAASTGSPSSTDL